MIKEKEENINPEQMICTCCGKTVWTTNAIVLVKGICITCEKQFNMCLSNNK